jgi:sec-independent protein translocase protein TatA
VIGDILQPTHLLFILVIALLVLGPKRLPEVGRSLGRGLRDFRTAISGQDQDQPHPALDEAPGVQAEPAVQDAATVPSAVQEPATVAPPVHEPATVAPVQEPTTVAPPEHEPTTVAPVQEPATVAPPGHEPASVSGEHGSPGSV